jgi:cytochrome P450
MTLAPLPHTPLLPPAPQDIYFSEEQQAWIVSRHRDVLAALRSADLAQARPPKPASALSARADSEKSCFAAANGWTHSESFTVLLNAHTSKRQLEINTLASALLQRLRHDHAIDLVAQFIRPWCLASAVALTRLDPDHAERLAQLVGYLSESDAAPYDLSCKSRAKEANRELDRFFLGPSPPYGKSMFLGIAQTMPYFLASAWAALLLQPLAWNTLHAHPGLVSKATEEFLRYAGPVHSIFRHAGKETGISGTKIPAGHRLILCLASANRDPEQFPNPNVLDINRSAAGHLALSSGPHYCVGAPIVRMMTATATQAILSRYPQPRLSKPVEWSWGNMVTWPSSLPILPETARPSQ